LARASFGVNKLHFLQLQHMPLRSHGKRAALPAAARGSLDIREVFRGTAVAAPCVPTVDSGEPPSNHKRKRVPSPHAASAKQIDVREALLRGSQQHCQSSLTSYSLSLAQEEALATWGENSFHAACQAWNIMDDHASPLLLLANSPDGGHDVCFVSRP